MFAVNKSGISRFLLLGDHAGSTIPAALGDLGLPPQELRRHIALDIGVHDLGLALAEKLDAPFIAQRYSRLVIDCNRRPTAPDSIAEVSDGTLVPGNQKLSQAARQARLDEVFTPYHAAIGRELDERAARGQETILIFLHSFTPVFAGTARPWRYGVLHMNDSPFSMAVLAKLRADHGEDVVGDNQPYQMDGTDFSAPHHAHARGLDYLELEVRQDLLETPDGVAAVASDVLRCLA